MLVVSCCQLAHMEVVWLCIFVPVVLEIILQLSTLFVNVVV
jgi:hypothetical protein